MLFQMAEFHSFLWLLFPLYIFVDGCLGCFHILAIVNNAAVNIGVHVSFELLFPFTSSIYPRIAGSYDSSIFIF